MRAGPSRKNPRMHDHERELVESFDLRDLPKEFFDNPFPYYRALRELAPIKPLRDGAYFLTRYDDLMTAYRSPTIFSSDKKAEFRPKFGQSLLYEHHTTTLVFNDPPLHTRVRKLIVGALTPRAIMAMERDLVTVVDRRLDDIAKKDTVDLIEDFAVGIPVEIIGNLLGVPHDARGPLRAWSTAILTALEPALPAGAFEDGNGALREFLDYLEILVAARRAHPGNPERDVLTRLIQGEESGERLTAAELLHNCIFLLNAGHETTTNLIGNGLVALAQFPEERRRLIAEPELIKTAVDEILRYESSVQLGNRITTQATQIGGIEMPAGTRLALCIGAANRDPLQFPDPERFDVVRTPNRHLAFAGGAHQCAGLMLARLEGTVAISRFLARFPDYALSGEPVRSRRARFRGFQRVPSRLRR